MTDQLEKLEKAKRSMRAETLRIEQAASGAVVPHDWQPTGIAELDARRADARSPYSVGLSRRTRRSRWLTATILIGHRRRRSHAVNSHWPRKWTNCPSKRWLGSATPSPSVR
jgi:hypothetical protein